MTAPRITLEGYVSVSLPLCPCGAAPDVVAPGSDGEFTDLLGQRLYTVRPVADRGWCWVHARQAGWPWLKCEGI